MHFLFVRLLNSLEKDWIKSLFVIGQKKMYYDLPKWIYYYSQLKKSHLIKLVAGYSSNNLTAPSYTITLRLVP